MEDGKLEYLGHTITWDEFEGPSKRIYLVDGTYVCTNFEEATECVENLDKEND